MDSNNINRPDNTNTPDIPTENIPPNPMPSHGNFPQDNPPRGNPADIQNRPPMPNEAPDRTSAGSMPVQDRTPYGTSGGMQNQNSTPYGMPNRSQSQNSNPYGMPNGTQNQNSNPYGMPGGTQNQNSNPYGMPNGTQNQNNNPYGMPSSTQSQNNNPYGYPNGTQNRNAYGTNNLQNQNGNPYGNPNGAPYPNNYQPVQKSPADGLITATLALSIATIVSALLGTVYFPFILGGIGIVLALLSKGYDEKMSPKSKIAVMGSIVGIILNILVVGTSVYKVFTDERTFNQFDQIYERMYGESFRDMYKNATGEDFPFNFDD